MDLLATSALAQLADAHERYAKGFITLSQWGAQMCRVLTDIEHACVDVHILLAHGNAPGAGASALAFFQACENEFATMSSHDGFLQSDAYIGMQHMLSALSQERIAMGRNTFIDYLLNHCGWDPTTLCSALSRIQPFEEKARIAQNPLAFSWETNLHYSLLASLGVAAIFTPWQPPAHDVYGGMWYVTPFRECEDPSAAVAAIANKMPWSFGQALEFYKDENEEDMSASMTHTIFSMSVQQAHLALTAKTLLEMTFDHDRYHVYREGLELFESKHPDLFLALQLQASMLDYASDAEGVLPAFLPKWEHAVKGTTKQEDRLPLPELGLEGP